MAILLSDYGAAILCVPKTGTRWLRKALPAAGLRCEKLAPPGGVTQDHCALCHAMQDGRIRNFAATVRHPLGWLESHWRFQCDNGWRIWEPGAWHPLREIERTQDRGFNVWLIKMLGAAPGFVSRMFEWYHGPPGCGFVSPLRQESLADDTVAWLRSIGAGFDEAALRATPTENASATEPPRWGDWLRGRFEFHEQAAIRRFYE